MPFAEMWIDLQTVIQNEVSQKEKNQHHIVLLVQMNLFAKQKQTQM